MGREVTTDLAMLERLAPTRGKDVVDVGCGGGALVRELARAGARVIGVEISREQLAAAVARDPDGRSRYLVGRAEALPLGDDSTDVVLYLRSLHHVAPGELMTALREARRVLRPGGAVYVAEPLAEGDFFELVSLVENEVEARGAAQGALDDAPAAGLQRVRTVDYDVRVCIADLAGLRARIVSVDPARADRFDDRAPELAEAFGRLGEAGERAGERCFLQPMRADVLIPGPGAVLPSSSTA